MILLFIGILLGIGCIRFKESLPAEKRSKTGVWATFRSFGIIVHNRRYMLYVFQLAFAQGILFAYICFFPLYHSAALRVFSFCLQHLLCGKCSGYRSGCRPIGEISPHRERNADRMHWDAGVRSPSDGGTL